MGPSYFFSQKPLEMRRQCIRNRLHLSLSHIIPQSIMKSDRLFDWLARKMLGSGAIEDVS